MRRIFLSLFLPIFLLPLTAQRNYKSEPPRRSFNAAEIQQALRHSQILGSVLYIAAHPDDENTRLISYLVNGRGLNTTYLSLTRGSGGQNLIGTEKGPALGLLRTQELLAARNIDGGEQRFSRAIDFGYSKNPEETLEIWDKDRVLRDVVRVIRQIRPDVIVTRFPGPEDGGGGHGHHTASYILAREAFDKAADPEFAPQEGEPWRVKHLFWNNWRPYWGRGEYDPDQLHVLDVGAYDPLLGKSYNEIASASRSQHKCQAFGTYLARGTQQDYLELKAGDSVDPSGDFLAEIDLSWDRVPGGQGVGELLARAEREFEPANPNGITPILLDAFRALQRLPAQNIWVQRKQEALIELIAQTTGLWFEALADDPTVTLGDSLGLTTTVLRRSDAPVRVRGVQLIYNLDQAPSAAASASSVSTIQFEEPLETNVFLEDKRTLALPTRESLNNPTVVPTQPYWLTRPPKAGTYQVEVDWMRGLPETPDPLYALFVFEVGEENPVTLGYSMPVVHKYADRAVGEMYRPLVVVPPVTVNIADRVYLFSNTEAREVTLRARNHRDGTASGTLRFETPAGWRVSPEEISLEFEREGEEKVINITLTPPQKGSQGALRALVTMAGADQPVSYAVEEIEYDHIPTQLLFPPAETRIVRVELEKRGERIGYIMGSGDEVPEALREVGYEVTLLEDEDITQTQLAQFDAIVVGIRAFNRRKRLGILQEDLLRYVENGGTMVVQYNTTYDLDEGTRLGPYPITLSRDRVTREEAEVRVLAKRHPVLTTPNRLSAEDWSGWVQERGLYFPSEWDERYTAVLEMNDPEEPGRQGSLLVAEYGQGHFVYTGLSFFRELPAGVPGAYRLFANMLSLGK